LQAELERELIRMIKAGDTRFYEPLVRAYEPSGLRLAVAMMGNAEDAKDALQDAFVKTFNSLHRFDLSRPFGPWFFQILRNQCRDMLRSRKARFNVELGPEQAHQRTTAKETLWKGLEQIGDEHREILVLKELQGFRYSEIAQILDIPEGTVASRLYHARHALKGALILLGVEYA
jgi:RNA polymerase sigma factor (sigma-70 family)